MCEVSCHEGNEGWDLPGEEDECVGPDDGEGCRVGVRDAVREPPEVPVRDSPAEATLGGWAEKPSHLGPFVGGLVGVHVVMALGQIGGAEIASNADSDQEDGWTKNQRWTELGVCLAGF